MVEFEFVTFVFTITGFSMDRRVLRVAHHATLSHVPNSVPHKWQENLTCLITTVMVGKKHRHW